MSENSTTQSRYIKSYEIRRAYQGGVQYPPAISGVQGAIDIHCHADAAHQDALSVAKLASKNGMRGILYKSIAGKQRAESVQKVREALHHWCDAEKVEPILCWSGCNVANRAAPPSAAKISEQLDAGINAVWMPVAMHANTLSQIGGRKSWWGSERRPRRANPGVELGGSAQGRPIFARRARQAQSVRSKKSSKYCTIAACRCFSAMQPIRKSSPSPKNVRESATNKPSSIIPSAHSSI